MQDADEHPYSQLTPDVVLDAVQSAGLQPDGRLLALNSYENRVYQVMMEDGPPLVAKFYRPGRWSDAQIAEEHAYVGELAEREIPVVAPRALADGGTLAEFGGFRFALYARCGGRPPELEDRSTLEWLGRFIGRIHAVGARRPFVVRPALDVDSFGEEPRAWLLAHEMVPPDLRASWASVAELALEGVRACYRRAGTPRPIRAHGDCHAGNVLWREGDARAGAGNAAQQAGPHFVDFDDARMAPAVQDLWMLLSGDRALMEQQLSQVLAGYEDFFEFDRRELQLVEALRTLRLLHYSAWLAQRWGDPAFPAAFPWFNTQRYWQDRILELREQVALMQEPPLAPA